MDFLFQVFHARRIDPETGQRMLDQMAKQAKLQQSVHGGAGNHTVRIEGVTRHDNPYPVWLARMLMQAGCFYDDFNMVYQCRCDQARAYQLREWFEYAIRPWASQDPAWVEYMSHIESRVMDADREHVGTLQAF